MPQSLSKVWVHCIFSVKHRQNLISDDIRKELHSYIIGTFSNLGSYVKEIYANSDHVHILCTLPRTITISDLISKTKSSSSKFLKSKGLDEFSWQRGYAVFSVSSTKVDIVMKYISDQETHHRKYTFQDEYRNFLREYNVEYDERYVWD